MAQKYFHEVPDNNHYDSRFFNGELDVEARQDVISKMALDFSTFSESRNIKPIIMHGSLIGWYWNQRPLPWDPDIDICLFSDDAQRLEKAAMTYNQSQQQYLCDINPDSDNRTSENSHYSEGYEMNRIDARFIDKATGLFIDITYLTESSDGETFYTKCPHVFQRNDILPISISRFAEAIYYTPRNVAKLLIDEYGQDVFEPYFNEYVFDDSEGKWKLRGTLLAEKSSREIVEQGRPVIFIHIPKTAGTSIRKALEITHLEDGSSHFGVDTQFIQDTRQEFDDTLVFTVVRNPYDRAWSIYKFFSGDGLSEHPANQITRLFAQCLSVEQFWCDVDIHGLMQFLPHVRTQASFIDDKVRVLKFENLQDEWDRLIEELGQEAIPLEKEMQSPGIDWSLALSEKTRKSIAKIYNEDFLRFGYSF